MKATMWIFFTDEKVFYTNPLINNKNDDVWLHQKRLL